MTGVVSVDEDAGRVPALVILGRTSGTSGVTHTVRVRGLLAAPRDEDGLPAFLPFLDALGREVWVERRSMTEVEHRRALDYARQLVRESLLDPLHLLDPVDPAEEREP